MWRDPSGLVPPRPTVCPTFDCKEHPVLCECRINVETQRCKTKISGASNGALHNAIKKEGACARSVMCHVLLDGVAV